MAIKLENAKGRLEKLVKEYKDCLWWSFPRGATILWYTSGLRLPGKRLQEEEFVEQVMSTGVVKMCACKTEGKKDYWYFDLANGTRRYWANLSEESQKILGIDDY